MQTQEQKNKLELNKLTNRIQWDVEELMNKNNDTRQIYKTALIDGDGCVTGYTITIDIKSEVFTNNDPF